MGGDEQDKAIFLITQETHFIFPFTNNREIYNADLPQLKIH